MPSVRLGFARRQEIRHFWRDGERRHNCIVAWLEQIAVVSRAAGSVYTLEQKAQTQTHIVEDLRTAARNVDRLADDARILIHTIHLAAEGLCIRLDLR